MKRFKNNKGVTGVDIAVSVSIIVITLGIVMAIYTSYSNKSKEIKRNSVATNLAMTVIEHIETTDINHEDIESITSTEKIINNGYGITNKPNGYEITVKKIESSGIINNVAFQIDVIVSYRIEDEIKTVTLSTIKKYDNTEEAERPNMGASEIAECFPIKYDSDKAEYVQTSRNDSTWYSITSRKFPLVAKLRTGENIGVDGIIKLGQCEKIYVWIPSYGTYGGNNRYCNSNGYIIKYETVDNISAYKTSSTDIVNSGTKKGGYWVELMVDNNKLKDKTGTAYANIQNLIFSWN